MNVIVVLLISLISISVACGVIIDCFTGRVERAGKVFFLSLLIIGFAYLYVTYYK